MKRDLWSVPPGAPSRSSLRSTVRGFIAITLIIALGLATGAVVRWVGTSTPIGADEALQQFRARTKPETPPRRRPTSNRTREERTRSPQKSPGSSDEDIGRLAERRSRARVAVRGEGDQRSESLRSQPAPPRYPLLPDEGVYTWQIEGYERAGGIRRELPERSHRAITIQGERGWMQHDFFSEEREAWTWAKASRDGVHVTRTRHRGDFGPITIDRTIVFNPPMVVSPGARNLDVGQTWRGSWSGRTSGDYHARTLDHTYMTIGGERVEVWCVEIVLRLRGEVEGDATYRSWIAPEDALVVKQYEKTDVTSGPASYSAEWSGRLLSLQPQA